MMAYDGRLGRQRPVVNGSPVLSSDPKKWDGFLFEVHHVDDGQENCDLKLPHTIVGVHLGQPTRVEVEENGVFKEKVFQPGDVSLVPAGIRYSIRWADPAEFMIISLGTELLNRASQTATGEPNPKLRILWCHRDAFITETLHNVRMAVQQNRPVDHGYVETLVSSLAMHIVRNCNQKTGRSYSANGRGLSQNQLDSVIEFIRNSPYQDITLNTMAASARLSPFHFARMFKLSTGLSPHQYVLKRRLEIGAEMLANPDLSIAEIALDLGFADQSHFTMHFKRAHGIAPAAYRRQLPR